MCFGGEAGPDHCPESKAVKCTHCGRRWEAPDVWNPGRCPGCGQIELGFTVARCDVCPLEDLEEAREHSRAGKLLTRLIELDFSVDRFRLGWGDVTAEEARGLRVLKEERDRLAEEQRKEMEREALLRQGR
jgi:hypothetical protein